MIGTRGPVPKRSTERRRRNNKPADPGAVSRVTTYPCGCALLEGYDSLGRQGWHLCTEHDAGDY